MPENRVSIRSALARVEMQLLQVIEVHPVGAEGTSRFLSSRVEADDFAVGQRFIDLDAKDDSFPGESGHDQVDGLLGQRV